MELVEKNDNIERVYSVSFDREKIMDLLDVIVKNISYRTDGTFTVSMNSVEVDFENNRIIAGANLPNGDPMYENIEKMYPCTSKSAYSYHNDSIAIEGTKITPPYLAYIIQNILLEKNIGIYDFLNYEETFGELISIDEQINMCSSEIDEISNFKTEKKIEALNRLKKLCEEKQAKQYYNVELLKQYYLKAYSLIELELISEKEFKSGNKILLKDLKDYKKLDK